MKKLDIAIICVLIYVYCGCRENIPFNDIIVEGTKTEGFLFDEEKLVNIQEVLNSFYHPDFKRNIEVVNDLEKADIPQEMIEVLISENGGSEEDEIYKRYLSDNYTNIDLSNMNDTELRNVTDLIGDRAVYDIKKVDIDYDGECEYLIEYAEGTGDKKAISIFKNVDRKLSEIYYIFDEYGHYELLEQENKFYILAGDYIVYYNKTAEDWEKINVSKTVLDYEAYEFFSDSQLLEEKDIINSIDLLDRTDWVKVYEYSYTLICGTPNILKQKIGEDNYIYIYTDFRNHTRNDRSDRLLFVAKEVPGGQYEIIKAYYLVADIQLSIEWAAD